MAKTPIVQVQQKEGEPEVLIITVKDAGSVEFDTRKAHADVRAYAAFHGFKQRAVDTTAMSRDTATGASPDPTKKLEAIRKLVEYYETGAESWSRVSEGGPTGGYLFEALCVLFDGKHDGFPQKSADDVRTWLDAKSDKEQAALRQDDTVAPIIDEIKKSKVKPVTGVDTKGLLGSLKEAAAPAQP